MTIVVCPLSRVSETLALHAPARVISLLDPETPFPETGPDYAGRHLRVSMHDITRTEEGWIAPGEGHIETLLHFLREWEPEAPLLVHCYAGISRSTATAFVAACLHNPETSEREIAAALRFADRHAQPPHRFAGRRGAAAQRPDDRGDRRHRARHAFLAGHRRGGAFRHSIAFPMSALLAPAPPRYAGAQEGRSIGTETNPGAGAR